MSTPVSMNDTIQTVLAAKRKRLLVSKPVFQFSAPVAEMGLFKIARRLNCKLTLGLSQWLRAAGYGDIDGTLFFREDCFVAIEHGTLAGKIIFARDNLGNGYAFDPKDSSIYFVGMQQLTYARMAKDFGSFLQELIRRDYNLAAWRDSLHLEKNIEPHHAG